MVWRALGKGIGMSIHGSGRLSGVEDGETTMIVDCCHVDTGYTVSGGIDLTSDYTPPYPMNGLILCGNGADKAGDVDVTLEGGGRMLVPCSVPSGYHDIVLRGVSILTLHSSATTTFTGRIIPIWPRLIA
jgi:hypothetical protein